MRKPKPQLPATSALMGATAAVAALEAGLSLLQAWEMFYRFVCDKKITPENIGGVVEIANEAAERFRLAMYGEQSVPKGGAS